MKIGLVKPSTNVTMELELPRFIPGLEITPVSVDLVDVTAECLAIMNSSVPLAAKECVSKESSLVVSACLVATMLAPGGHDAVELQMSESANVPAITSTGALVRQLLNSGHTRIALIAPYSDDLTDRVIDYLRSNGIETVAHRNFNVVNNYDVANIPTDLIVKSATDMDLSEAEALVVSACVQMPSFEALQNKTLLGLGLPLTSASQATANEIISMTR